MGTLARIYKPAKSAMQSGTAKTKDWVLEFEPDDARFIEHVMGWTGSADMTQELKLFFDSRDEAVRYAEKHAIPYEIQTPRKRRFNIRAYADNFSYQRIKAYN